MKDETEINAALSKVDEFGASKFPGMTYEQGVAEALKWVIGFIPDDEFAPLGD